MIKIKVEKIVDGDGQKVKILEIEMLKHEQLPKNYKELGESVCLYAGFSVLLNSIVCHYDDGCCNDRYSFDQNGHIWLKVGANYSPEEFNKRINQLRKGVKWPQKNNELLVFEKKEWAGTETITI